MSHRHTEVYYDDKNVGGALVGVALSQPTPFVTISNEMITHGGKRWGQKKSIQLAGQLTGEHMNKIVTEINSLASVFGNNFQDLKIYEEGSLLQTFSNCKVESINFDKGTYAQIVDYSVSLSCYENFIGQFGVTNPSEKFSFSQNENKTATLTHECSAQGFKTGSAGNNAFENAKAFVSAFTGWNNQLAPAFVNSGGTVYPVLLSVSEGINRIGGSYSVTENYILSEDAPSKTPTAVLSATSHSYNVESDVNAVEVSLTCQGGKDFTLAQTRAHALSIDLYQEAINKSSNTGLLVDPVSITLDEDDSSNTVTIKATFDDDKLFIFDGDSVNNTRNAYMDSSVSIDSDELIGISTFNVSSTIIGRGNAYQRWQNQLSFLANNVSNIDEINRDDDIVSSMRAEAQHVYSQLNSTFANTFPINKRPTSLSLSKNEYTNEISISASFDNADIFGESSADVFPIPPAGSPRFGLSANYSINITPSLRQFRPNPSCVENGHYLIYDLNSKNKEQVEIDINIIGNGWGDADGRTISANGSLTTEQSLMQQRLVGAGNTILARAQNRWLNMNASPELGGAWVASESQEFNQHARTYMMRRSYSQDQYNLSLNDGLQYVRVNTNG